MMRCRPPFVYNIMYVCMYVYICPSQPETPRLHNSPVFSAGAHDNKTLYLATVSHKTAQHVLHFIAARCVQIVVNVAHCSSEGYTPVGDSTILADVICPTWSGTLPLFPRVERTMCTVLAQQELASLRSSKYVGVDCPAAIQCFVWLAIPSF